jgi:DNA-directed RNA polymerase subunit K
MIAKIQEKFTKYETARILGARALQISMDAPLLLKIDKEELEKISYDCLKIAEIEFSANVLPITVKRPLPRRLEAKLKREQEEVKKEEEAEKLEKKEETEIKEKGEIMELVKPEDEIEEETEEQAEEETEAI